MYIKPYSDFTAKNIWRFQDTIGASEFIDDAGLANLELGAATVAAGTTTYSRKVSAGGIYGAALTNGAILTTSTGVNILVGSAAFNNVTAVLALGGESNNIACGRGTKLIDSVAGSDTVAGNSSIPVAPGDLAKIVTFATVIDWENGVAYSHYYHPTEGFLAGTVAALVNNTVFPANASNEWAGFVHTTTPQDIAGLAYIQLDSLPTIAEMQADIIEFHANFTTTTTKELPSRWA